ncbi:unnamed protein product [Ilex paraguariensis]|uniref:Secreted protein n=1 Tax=Ilex paraguariensis TaxID=185542 RepID=A0ABC8RSH3_9AQUA
MPLTVRLKTIFLSLNLFLLIWMVDRVHFFHLQKTVGSFFIQTSLSQEPMHVYSVGSFSMCEKIIVRKCVHARLGRHVKSMYVWLSYHFQTDLAFTLIMQNKFAGSIFSLFPDLAL